jgi:transposase
MSSEQLHRDEDWLQQKYWEEEMSMAEIADEAGVHHDTIRKWMERFDIERREIAVANSIQRAGKGKRYRDEEWLREKYVSEGLSTVEIADICDVHHTTILTWLNRFDIETRTLEGRDNYAWTEYCGYTVTKGRPVWHIGVHTHYNGQFYPVHRLLAIAEFGAEEVADKEVHHKNGIPWDNRPDNLEILDPVTHSRRHAGRVEDDQRDSPVLRECDLCGEMVDLDRAIPNDRGEACHERCWAEYVGAPDWFTDY